MTRIDFKLLNLLVILGLPACGLLQNSAPVVLNDATPSGTITHTGSFGTNSNSISGVVFVYANGGSTTVRLESFSSSQFTGLLVRGTTSNGSTPLNSALKGTSGNQNYTVSSSSGNWSSVQIIDSTQPPPNDILATALLESQND